MKKRTYLYTVITLSILSVLTLAACSRSSGADKNPQSTQGQSQQTAADEPSASEHPSTEETGTEMRSTEEAGTEMRSTEKPSGDETDNSAAELPLPSGIPTEIPIILPTETVTYVKK